MALSEHVYMYYSIFEAAAFWLQPVVGNLDVPPDLPNFNYTKISIFATNFLKLQHFGCSLWLGMLPSPLI